MARKTETDVQSPLVGIGPGVRIPPFYLTSLLQTLNRAVSKEGSAWLDVAARCLCRSDPLPSSTYRIYYNRQYKTIRHYHILFQNKKKTSDWTLFLSKICMKKLHK